MVGGRAQVVDSPGFCESIGRIPLYSEMEVQGAKGIAYMIRWGILWAYYGKNMVVFYGI